MMGALKSVRKGLGVLALAYIVFLLIGLLPMLYVLMYPDGFGGEVPAMLAAFSVVLFAPAGALLTLGVWILVRRKKANSS